MVVLFGAGATRAAFVDQAPAPPIDADFLEVAARFKGRGTGRLAKQVTNDVFSLYRRIAGVGLEAYYRDIETRLELGKFAKPRHKPKNWKLRTEQLDELVRRVLIHTTCSMEEGAATPRTSWIHEAILERVKSKDTLITFNYDTVIEESIPRSSSLWAPRDGYGLYVTGLTHNWAKKWLSTHDMDETARSKIKLLKLHGSINWRLNINNQVSLKQRPYVVRARKGAPVFEKVAIVGPGWHKPVNRNPYRQVWKQTRDALDRCTTLAIIGYSLPETDLVAQALFLEVVRERAAAKQFFRELHIADVSESVINRVLDLFMPALGPHGLIYRYSSAEELARTWSPKTTGREVRMGAS